MNLMKGLTVADDGEDVFAKSPFDRPDGDIIIRSSNGIHFRINKVLLSLASPIFRDMFSLPRSADESVDATKDGLPIVELIENSQTIENLLSLCYPAIYSGRAWGSATLSEVSALLEVARKYEMEETRKAVVPMLTKPQFLKQEPLRVFAIACQQQLVKEAELAAKHTLQYPILEEKGSPELAKINGQQLYGVLRYRKECADAAMKVASTHTWIKPIGSAYFDCVDAQSSTTVLSSPSRKYKDGYELTIKVHSWWMEYMADARVALQNSSCGQTVREPGRVGRALAAAGKCSRCGSRVTSHFEQFVEEFAKEVDENISEV